MGIKADEICTNKCPSLKKNTNTNTKITQLESYNKICEIEHISHTFLFLSKLFESENFAFSFTISLRKYTKYDSVFIH